MFIIDSNIFKQMAMILKKIKYPKVPNVFKKRVTSIKVPCFNTCYDEIQHAPSVEARVEDVAIGEPYSAMNWVTQFHELLLCY